MWSDLSTALMIGIGFVKDVVTNLFDHLIDIVDSLLFYRIIIDPKENPRCRYAIVEELKSKEIHQEGVTLHMVDGGREPEYELNEGHFIIQTKTAGKIHISLSDKKITIRSLSIPYLRQTNMANFKGAIEDLYRKFNAPQKIMMFYTSSGDSWATPICRKPRNFSNIKPTPDMKNVLDDIDVFSLNNIFYEDEGIPYKIGYFLFGETGTGKSTIVEMTAYNKNMSIYMLNLNCKDMTDTILINLLSRVPPNSIICIDEIDKQIDSLKKNKTANITIAGLLTALDGPQRLNHGVIIIMTANNDNFLNGQEKEALFRNGRIDKIFTLKDKFPNEPCNYKVIEDYIAEDENELTIKENYIVKILRKRGENDWWLAEIVSDENKGETGWIPSTFIVRED